jgi:hypothetical protein
MTPDKVKKFLEALQVKVPYAQKRTGWTVSECPLGPWRHVGGKSSAEVFGVRHEAGDAFAHCWSCGWHGSLGELLTEMKHLNKTTPKIEVSWGPLYDAVDQSILDGDLDLDVPDIEEVMASRGENLHEFPQWWLDTFPPAMEIAWAKKYLAERAVTPASAEQLDLRADTDQRRICFPVRDFKHRLVGLHGRAVVAHTEPRYRMYLQAGKNNPIVWLGEDWVDLNRPIVVVEGPFDLASVKRVYDNVVSPLFVNPSFAKMKRMTDALEWVTLYDRGAGGDAGRDKVSKLLGHDHVITHLHPPKGRKDPGEMVEAELAELFGPVVQLIATIL